MGGNTQWVGFVHKIHQGTDDLIISDQDNFSGNQRKAGKTYGRTMQTLTLYLLIL